jgi:hypothetical protein
MSTFHCTRCGSLMGAPAAGTRAACPTCGQLLATPADLDEQAAPVPRRGRPEYSFVGEGGYGRPASVGHSVLGVASFIIGLVVLALTLLIILLFGIGAGSPHWDTAHSIFSLAAAIFYVGMLVCLVGVVLGVGGLFQWNRNRTLAVIGLILNGLALFGGGVLLMLTMVALTNR